MKTIRAQIYLICSVLCLSIVLGLMPSQKAAAAGETWEWLNGTFHVRGGDLASQTTFTFVREERGAQHGNDTGTFNIYQGTLQHRNNCTIDMTLFIPLSNTTIIYTDVTGGSCSGAIQAAYDNLTASTEDNSGGGGNDGVGNFQWGSNRALIQTYGINIFSGGTRTTTLPIAAGDTSPQVTISPLGGYFVNPAWAQVNPAPPPDQLPENDKGIYVAGQVVDVVATINNGVGDLGKNTYRCTMRYQLQLTSNESPNSAHLTSWTDRPSATAQIEVENFQYADGRTWTAPDAATFCEMVENSFELDLPETVTIYGDPGGIVAVTALQIPEGSDDPVTAPGTPDVDPCAQNHGPMGWILCPMQGWMMDVAEGLDRVIVETLVKIDTEAIFADSPYTTVREGPTTSDPDENIATTTAFREAWEAFRNIAYALLVIFGLIMVVSQIIGLELFDAYTIRKMLPRLVLVAIILPLLWPLLAFVFNMANDSANAVQTIMISPFRDIRIVLDDTEFILMREFTTGAMVVAILGAIFVALVAIPIVGAWGIVFALIVSAVIGLLSAFFVLMARDIVAYILIIASPIAVLCAAFEPFRKVFALWRSYLLTILLSIPAIMAVLTAGKIAAGVAMVTNQNMGPILGFLFVIVSYVMFWPVFKRLDKVSGMIDDAVSKVTNLAQKPLRRYMGKRALEGLGEISRGQGNYGPPNGIRRRVGDLIQGTASLPTALSNGGWRNPRTFRANMRSRIQELRQPVLEGKTPEATAIKNDDAKLSAGLWALAEAQRLGRAVSREDIESYLRGARTVEERDENGQIRYRLTVSEEDLDKEVAMTERAMQSLGDSFGSWAFVTKWGTGSGYGGGTVRLADGRVIRDDHERAFRDADRVSGGDRDLLTQILSDSKGAAMQARRFDWGSRLGIKQTTLEAVRDAGEGSQEAQDAINNYLTTARRQQSMAVVAGGRPETADAFLPTLQREVTEASDALRRAYDSGDLDAIREAERDAVQAYATYEAILDSLAQAAPEIGVDRIADQFFGASVDQQAGIRRMVQTLMVRQTNERNNAIRQQNAQIEARAQAAELAGEIDLAQSLRASIQQEEPLPVLQNSLTNRDLMDLLARLQPQFGRIRDEVRRNYDSGLAASLATAATQGQPGAPPGPPGPPGAPGMPGPGGVS